MPSPDLLIRGVAAPLLVAFAATLISIRVSKGRRGAAAIGFLTGQTLGTVLAVWGQPDWFPDRNLDWVPWAAAGAAIIGPMLVAHGLTAVERWALAGLASLGAAVLIVPDWPDLSPARPVSIPCVAVAFAILARGVDAIAGRTPPRLVVLSLTFAAMMALILIAASLSLSVAGSVMMTTLSLAGVSAALLIRPDEQAIRGLALPYAVAVGGWCYVSAIELPPPSPPLIGLLFVPLAPLLLASICVAPLARKSTPTRWIVGTILVAAFLVGAATWTWWSSESPSDEYGLLDG